MPGIFISYRRVDTKKDAARLYDHLSRKYGKRRVYKDVNDIHGGTDFVNALNDALKRCDVVIVMIGHRWLTVTEPDGTRRLDNPDDLVRLEVHTALTSNRLVMPVLVDNVPIPEKHELPLVLRDLRDRNALPLREDPDFEKDVAVIMDHIKRYRRRFLLRKVLIALMALAVFMIVALAAAQVGLIDLGNGDGGAPVAVALSPEHLTGTAEAWNISQIGTQTALAETIEALEGMGEEEAQAFIASQTAIYWNGQTATARAQADDSDGDGLTNQQEDDLGTRPDKADTDGDGLTDGDEINTYETDPLARDTDGDTLSDGAEINTHHTDPLKEDTDGDELLDGDEVRTHDSDPLQEDTDGDGLSDYDEVREYFTEPDDPDSDDDTLSDGDEVNEYHTSPNKPDSDEDGLEDDEEVNGPSDPNKKDTDGDGVHDRYDDCPTRSGSANNDGCPVTYDTDPEKHYGDYLITIYDTDFSMISTLDPQRAEDNISMDAIENLFVGLTNYNPLNPGEITPELATGWDVSEDGTTWTFYLRDDVPWVRWDPMDDEAEVMRMVTASDVAYGIQRACDPRLAAYYSHMAKQIIKGCDDLMSIPTANVTTRDYDIVEVYAIDDTTLVVNLQFPAGYFLSQTSMWIYRPVPREVIEEYGDDWTEVGTIWTNGPFVVDDLVYGVRRVYLRNPRYPRSLTGPGNVERIVTVVVEDIGTRWGLYLDNQIDITYVPTAELQSVLEDEAYADEVEQVSDLAVFYFGFAINKDPFDDARVRRAFSAAVDRNAFVQEVRQNRGIPMIHFTPPGMFGAPPINEAGVGYDPDFAREQMAEAGYPDCEGFPHIEIVTYTGSGTWAEFLAASVERELGCDPNLFSIEQQEFSVLIETVDKDNSPADRPNMWTYGWGPDYADANNWVNEVLYCEGQNNFTRPCSAVDDLILEAARETDQQDRIEMYYDIEEMFFGRSGDFPIIPLFLRIDYVLIKPWYYIPIETDGLFGGAHWDWRSINVD